MTPVPPGATTSPIIFSRPLMRLAVERGNEARFLEVSREVRERLVRLAMARARTRTRLMRGRDRSGAG